MIKKILVGTSFAVIASCGGGGSGGGESAIEVVVPGGSDQVNDICTAQSVYFTNLSGLVTGVLTEPPTATSMCEFVVEMDIENNPNPLSNCSVTGTLSYVGTQMIVDAFTPTICASQIDVPITVGQSVPIVTVQDSEIPLPTTLTLIATGEFPSLNSEGMVIRNPFNNSQTVTLDSNFSIQIDNFGTLNRPIGKRL